MVALWRTLFGIALVVTLYSTLTPMRGRPPGFPGLDKAVHVVLFAVDAGFGVLAFPKRGRMAVILGLLALGPVLELAQGYVPTRGPSIGDMIADWVGVAVGVIGAGGVGRAAERDQRPETVDRRV